MMKTRHSKPDPARHGHDHYHAERPTLAGYGDEHQGHSHGLVDPSIVRSKAGVKAVSLSLAVLLTASLVQLVVFVLSGSVALLTDVIHNGGMP